MITDSKKSLDNYYESFDRVLTAQKKTGAAFKVLQKKITENIGMESCDEIKSALQTLRDTIESLNDAGEKAIYSRLPLTVLEKIHESKSLTVTPMAKLLTTVIRDRSKWLERKTSKKNDKKENKERINDAKIKYELEAVDFYEKVADFEKARTHELRSLLTEFCNSQLFYHCKAAESWTKAVQKLSGLDMSIWYVNVDANVSNIMNKEKLNGVKKYSNTTKEFDDNESDKAR